MKGVSLRKEALSGDGVEWGIEGEGGVSLFLSAAFNWEKSLGPVAIHLYEHALLQALPHAWDKRES